jgi:hypothetical protein
MSEIVLTVAVAALIVWNVGLQVLLRIHQRHLAAHDESLGAHTRHLAAHDGQLQLREPKEFTPIPETWLNRLEDRIAKHDAAIARMEEEERQ